MVGATREEILAKSDTVAKFINNSPRSKDYKLHLLGGELFAKAIKQYFDEFDGNDPTPTDYYRTGVTIEEFIASMNG